MPLDAYLSEENYRAIVHGDVTGNWSPNAGSAGIAQKLLFDQRTIHIGAVERSGGRVTFPVLIDDMSDILAGDIDFAYNHDVLRPVDMRTTELTSEYLFEHRADDGRLRISFASAGSPTSGGGMVELIFAQIGSDASLHDAVKLDRVMLNEGAVPAQILEVTLPTSYALSRNYPNPFNPETSLRYELPKGDVVRISIYSSSGQLVRMLEDGYRAAGTYVVGWDGTDDRGFAVASGVYLCRMEAGSFAAVRKVLLMK